MEEIVKEILQEWGAIGAILIALSIYFYRKEKHFLQQQKETSEKLIGIIKETTGALTTISKNIEDLQKISEKLENLGEQLRYLRKFLEKVMGSKAEELDIEEDKEIQKDKWWRR